MMILFLLSCEENSVESQRFDLFPLQVGHEFYYSYFYRQKSAAENPDTVYANIKWTITFKTEIEGNNVYNFEQKFYNGMLLTTQHFPEVPNPDIDTVYLADQVTYFSVIENIDDDFWFAESNIPSEYDFYRTSIYSRAVLTFDINIVEGKWNFVFVADSGLVDYSYYRQTAMHSWSYSFAMDSLKLLN